MPQGHYKCPHPQRKDHSLDLNVAWLIFLVMPVEGIRFILVHLFCESIMLRLLRELQIIYQLFIRHWLRTDTFCRWLLNYLLPIMVVTNPIVFLPGHLKKNTGLQLQNVAAKVLTCIQQVQSCIAEWPKDHLLVLMRSRKRRGKPRFAYAKRGYKTYLLCQREKLVTKVDKLKRSLYSYCLLIDLF